MQRVKVYDKSGNERLMGEIQFKNWGSKNGFKLVPDNGEKKDIYTDNNSDSGKDTKTIEDATTTTETTDEKKGVVEIVKEIKAIYENADLSEDDKIKQINAFKDGETRATVLKAITKFGETKDEKDEH